MSRHKTYWLISLAASLKLKPKVSLAVKEKVSVYTLYWLCSRNFNNLHKFGQSFSHNYSRSTELPVTSRGSHLEWATSSQSFEGYLVYGGKEDVSLCSLKPFLFPSVSLLCPQYLYVYLLFQIKRKGNDRMVFPWILSFKKQFLIFISIIVKKAVYMMQGQGLLYNFTE